MAAVLELFRIANEVKKVESRWRHTPLISLSQSECSILSCDRSILSRDRKKASVVVASVYREEGGECIFQNN